MYYENKASGEFGLTIQGLRARFPNVSIPDNITQFSGWTMYEPAPAPVGEYAKVIEIQPKNGKQQWSISYDGVDKESVYEDISKQIDDTCAKVIEDFNRFRNGYYAREAEAKSYIESGYLGIPGQLIKGFADSAGMTYKDAADFTMQLAATLRKADTDVENLRMRKYTIRPNKDSIPEMIAKRDQIVNEIKTAVKGVK